MILAAVAVTSGSRDAVNAYDAALPGILPILNAPVPLDRVPLGPA